MSDLDSKFYRAIQVKPQPLGGLKGIPKAVFQRLYDADKVFINHEGLVEAYK